MLKKHIKKDWKKQKYRKKKKNLISENKFYLIMKNFEKKEKATDMELVQFLIGHINNPCEDSHGNNLRDFYIKEAKKVLDKIQDLEAKKTLEDIIQKYSK